MSQANVLIDSASSVTLADACVIPVLAGAVTGTGGAVAAQVSLADLATFFESGNAPVHITAANAFAFSVGLNGATNPAFNVDSSTASQAAGLNVIGATAAGTVAVAVISSGAAANLSLNAKGTGTISIAGTSTGAVSIGNTVNLTGATVSLSALGAASAIAGTTASGADQASGALTIKGHIGTGSGAVGGIVIQIPVTHGSDSVAQTLTTVLTLSATTTVAAQFAGTLGVTGATTLSSTLRVNGAASLGTAAGTDITVIDGTDFGAGVASLRLNGLTTAAVADQTGTLTNAPSAGNPTFWIPISIAGAIRYIPAWT